MMKKQYLKDDMPLSGETDEYRESVIGNISDDMPKTTYICDYPWLMLIIYNLHTYCGMWLTATDLDTLTFSLGHLFLHIDLLYTSVLPTLESDENMQKRHEPLALLPLFHQYHLWSQLRLTLRTLERIEILCHLLNVTVMGIIQMLDEDTESQRGTVSSHQSSSNAANSDENLWEEAALALEEQMLTWQQSYTVTPSLATSCADVVLPAHTLEDLDKAFQHILEGALALFGDILPDLRVMQQDNAETIAIRLLDLLQQNDDMLICIDRLIGPLDTLIKQYSQAMTTR